MSAEAPAVPRMHRGRPGRGVAAWQVAGVVLVVGVVVTAAATLAALANDRSTERRLLAVQTAQASNVISSAIVSIVAPLQDAVDVAAATDGDPARFTSEIAPLVGAGRLFASAALWRVGGPAPTRAAATGAAAFQTAAQQAAFAARAARSATFVVSSVASGGQQRVSYAVARTGTPWVVHAERAIPTDRRVEVESTSAFVDLHFASYLGDTTDRSALQTTDVDPDTLPLTGTTVRRSIPFGDTSLTLVASPARHLGSDLSRLLPWILLGGGLVLSLGAAVLAGATVRRRREAEADTATIATLFEQLDTAYGEQHAIAETLQRALLPQHLPVVPQLEVATRYVAGMRGTEVGGDWYTLVRTGPGRVAFVVGDVSGRGVEAAAVMARLRFTLRAYLLEGHAPEVALEMCARDLDITDDGHFATAVVGVADLSTGEVRLANAGHLDPLLVEDGGARFVSTDAGWPLGVGPTEYPVTALTLPPGGTLLLYTDGLVERRGEDLDTGLARLASAVAARPTGPAATLDGAVDGVLAALVGGGAEDDIAVLALRRVPAEVSGGLPDGLSGAVPGDPDPSAVAGAVLG